MNVFPGLAMEGGGGGGGGGQWNTKIPEINLPIYQTLH